MARDPLYGPTLDRLAQSRLTDYAPADLGLLRTIDARQHALMSGWGGPPTCRTVFVTSTGVVVPYRVPPGVVWVDLGLLVGGEQTINITTAADPTGTRFTTWTTTTTSAWEQTRWIRTGGIPSAGTAAAAATGRAIKVVASASWSWQDVDVTIAIAAYSGGSTGGVYVIEFAPIRRRE